MEHGKLHLLFFGIVWRAIYLSVILPGKLTENTFSFFSATTWGIVTGARRGMNEPIVNWGLVGDRDGLRARLGI